MSLALTILPLLLTLGAGYALRASGAMPAAQWSGIEALSFRLLIPAFLIRAIAHAELSGAAIGPFALALLVTVVLGGGAALALRALTPRERLADPSFTSLFQTTTRFNGLITLAAAELLRGPAGMVLIAVSMAVLIPVINIGNIVVMAAFGTARARLAGVLATILRNPLVQGSLLGLGLNLSGISLPGVVDTTLEMIGRAALGVGVLAVGAGVSLGRIARPSPLALLGLLLHPGLVLALFLALSALLDLSPDQRLIGALLFATPAATNGYVVARQMGGDAPLYADIMTLQTLLSLLLFPPLALLLAP